MCMSNLIFTDLYTCCLQVFSKAEMEFIADLCKKHNVIVIADEVYEFHVYSPNVHHKIGNEDIHTHTSLSYSVK